MVKNKAKQSQSYLAPRPVLGVETQFEKTKPICVGTNQRKVLCERSL